MKTFGVIFAILVIISLGQARTLTNHPHDHMRERREAEVEEEESGEEWRPPAGVRGEDWYNCHGVPCEQWNRTRSKINELTMLANQRDVTHPASIYTWAFDVVGSTSQDGSLDGCIYLTEAQVDELLEEMKKDRASTPSQRSGHSRRKRKLSNFKGNTFGKWDKFPLVYKFDGKHTARERQVIRSAFQHWMDQTCVTFREASTNELVPENHILITRNSTGCHSYVGRVMTSPQQLNLQYNCIWEFGVVVHEIGHSLGLWHEQQRSDRDGTIQVLYENLGYYAGQFQRIPTKSLGVPYDVGSVMHYAPRDGSTNGRETMRTHDPLYQSSMGQKTGLSFYDTMIINRAYCADRCKYVRLDRACERNGYQDPLDCQRCRCPPGFGGRFCERVANAKGESCGGTITVSSRAQTIQTPGYPSKSYDNHQECNWLIKAPRGSQVELRFVDEFAVYCHNQNQCHHWVEVQYNDHVGMPGPRFCCYRTPTTTLTSTQGEMAVVFRSNWTTSYPRTRIGFRAEIKAVRRHNPRDSNPSTVTSTTTTTTTTTATTTKKPTTTTTKRPTTTTTPAPTRNPPGSRREIWSCNFEKSNNEKTWCDMSQDRWDRFDWTLTSGPTPSDETGPNYARNGPNYIYIEASDPRRQGDYARIFLPYLKSQGYHCLRFSYHMYGFHIKELQVLQDGDKGIKVVWNKEGQQGNRWINAQIEVNLRRNDRLGFKAIRGNAFSGDIALDALSLKYGRC